MTEWAEQLIANLATYDRSAPSIVRLTSGLDGEEFERRLGEYLRQANAFLRARDLGWALERNSKLTGYHDTFLRVQEINRVIHETLYDMFGEDRVDGVAAGEAYSRLLKVVLGEPPTPRSWVYATTNYDTLGEQAVTAMGGLYDNGEIRRSRGFARVREGDVANEALSFCVPVLHLHGRVGWLRRLRDGDDEVISMPLNSHLPAAGTPLVMLPDLHKTYSDPVISALWRQFERYLERARLVLVLGHSLHDRALVAALSEKVQHPGRLAITYLKEFNAGRAAGQHPHVRKALPHATLVPISFDAATDPASPELSRWAAS